MTTIDLMSTYLPLFATLAALLVGGTCWVVWASFVLRGLRDALTRWSARIDGHRHGEDGAVYYPAPPARPREPPTALADRPG